MEKNFHNDVDVLPIGDQLFEIADHAWQTILVGSGDRIDRRYESLTGVGLALLSASERPPRMLDRDNPLSYADGLDDEVISNLAERSDVTARGNLKYRYNHQDEEAVLDLALVGISPKDVDYIPDEVLKHQRYPINGAAKRFYLLNHPNEWTSLNAEGLPTTSGELGMAGAIRYAGRRGIVSVSGGNMANDHAINRHWGMLAELVIQEDRSDLSLREVDELKIISTALFRETVNHQVEYAYRRFNKRLDELDLSQVFRVITETDNLLLAA